jgi:transposase
VPAGSGDQRALVARLRAVIEAKDTEIAVLRAELDVAREQFRRLELRVAELERRLGSDSTNSGMAPSKDPIGVRELRKAERARERQSSERERRKDRRRGGQPGHRGAGLSRDPDPDERTEAPPPAECSRCGTGLDGAQRAGTWWSQVRDVKIAPFVTEYLLPLLTCPCCGKVNAAQALPWAHPGSISYGPGINTAAVLLSSYGNVPAERAANLIGMLLGVPVSPGFVDGASERLSSRLEDAGFDDAMQAALAREPVLAADETPVNLLDPHAGLAEEDAGAPHVLVVRTPRRGLTWLRALGSRQAAAITAILSFFTGFLISDGYSAYQQLVPQLAGVQQCCQHVIRRCRAVTRLGPGSLQSWAGDVIEILREAHKAVEEALARGDPAFDAELLAKLRGRYDEAVAFGITHNRHRDWHDGNHPGYALGCWLRDYEEQVWLFTTQFAVDWTNNCSERAVKAAKRHQAVSGYWHTQRTLARWCRIRSYLDSAANYGITALDAITRALAGDPWLPAPQCHIEERGGSAGLAVAGGLKGDVPRLQAVAGDRPWLPHPASDGLVP